IQQGSARAVSDIDEKFSIGDERKRLPVWRSIRIFRVERGWQTTLTEPGSGKICIIRRPIGSLRKIIQIEAIDRCRPRILFAKLFRRPHTVVILREMLPDKVGLNLLARLPADRHAARPQIAAIDGLARRLVERIAVAYGPFARNTNVEAVIDNREIEHAFETAVFVIADIDGCHGLELIGRL